MPRADKIGLIVLATLLIAEVLFLLWPRAGRSKGTAPGAPELNSNGAPVTQLAAIDTTQGEDVNLPALPNTDAHVTALYKPTIVTVN